ncbi:glutamate ABC transporter substrate-binding protein [Nocardioides ultimimeridianus]
MRRIVPVALAAGLLLSGCGYADTVVPKPSAAAASSPAATTCTEAESQPSSYLRSYAPSAVRSGKTIDAIRQRGVLRVGVAWDTLRMGARNVNTNGVEGFDIDLARAIASALGVRAEFRVITASNRIPYLEDGTVDMVIRAFTINCDRWQQIAFSSEYFDAGQKVLVRKDAAASYAGPQSLAGKTVCAVSGTTSLANIQKVERKAIAVTAGTNTGCLMKFQQGDADAITSDDTVLAGLVAQDKYAVVPPQQPLEDEPYGVGMNRDAKDLVAFVNHVIAQYEQDGRWQASYDKWLKPYLKVAASPPAPLYGRS